MHGQSEATSMAYTVRQLAKISGVSVRTLHFYDEIGLLKPSYYDENKYRYYEEEQLLILQQILFYRKIGFPLDDIQKILASDDFDKINALINHKSILKNNLTQTKKLIQTIDKTIAYLRGNVPMKLEEIFHGFDAEKQKIYEGYLIDAGINKTIINESKEKTKRWKKDDWIKIKQAGDKIHEELVSAIQNNLTPASPEVQALIKRHYDMTTLFWTPNKHSYIGLGDLYSSNADFKKFYDDQHPKLLSFLIEAMKIYAERNLS